MKHAHAPIPAATYAKLFATMFFWGGTWVAGRIAVHDAPPLAVASWRFLLSAVGLGLLLVAREGGLPRLDRGGWTIVALLGVSGIFLYNLCFLYGMQRIEAGRGALVVALNPALIALLDWLFFASPMTPRRGVGISLALAGCLVVVGSGDPLAMLRGEVGAGELLILGCVVCWAAYTFIGRRATRSLSPLVATFYACVVGWALLTLAALCEGALTAGVDFGWPAWASIAFLGIFGTGIGFVWYADAVHRLGATRASAFINLVPVFAVLQGALLLGERLGLPVLLGGGLVLAGVVLTNRGPSLRPAINGEPR